MANAGLCCPFPGDEKSGKPYMHGLVSRYALSLCSIAFQENYGLPWSARLPTLIAGLLYSIKHAELRAFAPLRLLRPQRKPSYRLISLLIFPEGKARHLVAFYLTGHLSSGRP